MFILAERLARTVGELERSMSHREFVEWCEYLRMENEDRPAGRKRSMSWQEQKQAMLTHIKIVGGTGHGRDRNKGL